MYEEVRYGRLYEQIVEQVEERILSGELNPGDNINPHASYLMPELIYCLFQYIP